VSTEGDSSASKGKWVNSLHNRRKADCPISGRVATAFSEGGEEVVIIRSGGERRNFRSPYVGEGPERPSVRHAEKERVIGRGGRRKARGVRVVVLSVHQSRTSKEQPSSPPNVRRHKLLEEKKGTGAFALPTGGCHCAKSSAPLMTPRTSRTRIRVAHWGGGEELE